MLHLLQVMLIEVSTATWIGRGSVWESSLWLYLLARTLTALHRTWFSYKIRKAALRDQMLRAAQIVGISGVQGRSTAG
jgi:hypothetical protein